jgi:hypothetical protein
MRLKPSQLATAAAIVGVLGFGGMSLAYAQDSGTSGGGSTTTESPSTTDGGSSTVPQDNGSSRAPQDDHMQGGCPNMGGPDSGSDSGSSSVEGTAL